MKTTIGKFRKRSFSLKNGKKLTITAISPEESEMLIDFLQHIGEETTHTLQYPGREYSSYAIRQRIARTLQSRYDLLLGVKLDDEIVAHLDFQSQNERHPWIKHVARFGMAVRKEHQGQGIGTALIKAMLDWANIVGITRIETVIQTDNKTALKLCQAAGFELEGLRHNALLINDSWKDEYYLARIKA